MGDLVPFTAFVVAIGVVGVAAGILIARRLDRWDAARNDPAAVTDTTPGPDEEPDA